MNYQTLKNFLLIIENHFDGYLSVGFLIVGCILLLKAIISQNIVYTIFSVSLIFFVIVYIKYLKKSIIVFHKEEGDSSLTNKILNILFVLSYTLSIVSIYYDTDIPERPLLYFVLYVSMLAILLIQILFFLKTSGIFSSLIKIILLPINYIFSQSLLFNSLDSIDLYDHLFLTNLILKNGVIPPIGGLSYASYPVYHLLQALNQIVTGLNFKNSYLLAGTIPVIICGVLFIYLFGSTFASPRVGLLGSYILICSTVFLQFSRNIIPMSFGSVFLLIGIYAMVKINDKKKVVLLGVLTFVTFLLVITHPLNNVILVIILAIILLFSYRKRDNYIGRSQVILIILVSIIAMLSWWVYSTGNIITLFQLSSNNLNFYASKTVSEKIVSSFPLIETLHLNVSFLFSLLVGIPGSLYLISNRKKNEFGFGFSLTGLFLLAIVFGSQISGHDILNSRWYFFINFFFCVFIALTVVLLLNINKNTIYKIVLTSLLFLLCIIWILHPYANITNVFYDKHNEVDLMSTESENNMLLRMNTTALKPLSSDGTLVFIQKRSSGLVDINAIDTASYKNLDFSGNMDNIIILRNNMFTKTYDQEIYFPPKEKIEYALNFENFSKIFDVGTAYSFSYLR